MGSLLRRDRIPPATVSLFSADLLFQQTHHLGAIDLVTTFRQMLLVNDHVNIPTSFLLKSPHTHRLLADHPSYLDDGYVALAVDDKFSSIDEYIDGYDLKEYPQRIPYKSDVKKLASGARYYIPYNTAEMGGLGKASFLDQVRISFSTDFPDYSRALYEVADRDAVMNREAILQWASGSSVPDPVRASVVEKLNAAYVNAHQQHYNIQVEAPSDSFQHVISGFQDQKANIGGNLSDEEIAEQMMDLFVIGKNRLAFMSPDEFLDLRSDHEVRRFRDDMNTLRLTGVNARARGRVFTAADFNAIVDSYRSAALSSKNEDTVHFEMYSSAIKLPPEFADFSDFMREFKRLGGPRYNACTSAFEVVWNDDSPSTGSIHRRAVLAPSLLTYPQHVWMVRLILSGLNRKHEQGDITFTEYVGYLLLIGKDAIGRSYSASASAVLEVLFATIEEHVRDAGSPVDRYFLLMNYNQKRDADLLAVFFLGALDADLVFWKRGLVNIFSDFKKEDLQENEMGIIRYIVEVLRGRMKRVDADPGDATPGGERDPFPMSLTMHHLVDWWFSTKARIVERSKANYTRFISSGVEVVGEYWIDNVSGSKAILEIHLPSYKDVHKTQLFALETHQGVVLTHSADVIPLRRGLFYFSHPIGVEEGRVVFRLDPRAIARDQLPETMHVYLRVASPSGDCARVRKTIKSRMGK
ncbi:MAG: hypothetical protein JW839_04525 [Candidatus Lokiarchaeota archaeon]|nr:hypothetical protein [Candidatus Lokiarchaeota archaeon]